ncbi:hypothetical protein [Curtobacterium sp. MCLR17_034]|uniref:hypothetical protein n=1 Tax=Curtobacterium sp. MCLR17_034 TaxID=2175623 RepID=UPI0011B833C6|nr:hypothetical protein [Curtobacterium sp. MCLR17_034]
MNDPTGVRNTRESDADAQRGFEFLQLSFARLTALEQLVETLEERNRSSLVATGRRRRTTPSRIK